MYSESNRETNRSHSWPGEVSARVRDDRDTLIIAENARR